MIYAGIDIGSTCSKISVFDDDKYLFSIREDYLITREENAHTLDASEIFLAIKKLIKKAYDKAKIKAVGITSFGESFVMLDKEDNILMPTLLYTDLSGVEEAKELNNIFSKETLGEKTGQISLNMFSLPKIMYIKKHHKDIYEKCHHILLIEDYIVYALSGVKQIDYSLACRSLMFNINTKDWDEDILSKTGINKDLLSKPVKSGIKAGKIKDNLKKELEIFDDIDIYSISHDQISNALGAGVLFEGEAVDGNGTVECISFVYNKKQINPFLYQKGYGIVPYLNDELYISYILNYTGGAFLNWIIDTYFTKEKEIYSDIYSYLNNNLNNKPSKILILPYFAGAGTPYMDEKAKGAIINLKLSTSKFEIYKAALEALCYEMKLNLELLYKHDIKITKLVATGGGSVNDTFLQMKADIFNLPIIQLDNKDAGTVGSGMIMGVQLGIFKDLVEAKNRMIKIKKVFYPSKDNEKYNHNYKQYKKLYPLLKENFYE